MTKLCFEQPLSRNRSKNNPAPRADFCILWLFGAFWEALLCSNIDLFWYLFGKKSETWLCHGFVRLLDLILKVFGMPQEA